MALEPLAVDITGSALMAAEISGQEARATSVIVEAAITGGIVRATSVIAEAAITGGTVRATSVVVEAAFPNISIKALATAVTSTALVGADLAGLTRQLATTIIASALVVAEAETPQPLVVGLTANATVGPLLDKNLVNATSTLSLTQSAVNLIEHVGNTLALTQSATTVSTLSPDSSDLSGLLQSATVVATFDRSLSSVLGSLDHTVAFKAVLPTETASSTLSLSDSATAARAGENTLALTSVAVGVIGGILESAENTLAFTSVVALDTVLLLTPSDTLTLTQAVLADQVADKSAADSLNFNQISFASTVSGRCLVILQAPFDFLQTSIVLSCPLFGDTENIVSEVTLRRSMNGATQTHVKTNNNRRLTYTFRMLDRQKAVEVAEFFKFYNSDKIRLTNWKGEVWKVNLLTNPVDFVKTGRFRTDVSLEFEGIKLYG